MKRMGNCGFAENITVERNAGRAEYIDALKGYSSFRTNFNGVYPVFWEKG